MDDKEKIFLSYICEKINLMGQHRLYYLGFLVTINIAIYFAIYEVTNKVICTINCIGIILTLILIIINSIFSIIILREQNLSEITEEWFSINFEDSAYYSNYKKFIDERDKMRGCTWKSTKCLLITFGIIPVVYLYLLMVINFESLFCKYEYLNTLIIFILVLLALLFYLFFYFLIWSKEYKGQRNDKDCGNGKAPSAS